MPILCGTDIIEIDRIKKSFDTSGTVFRDKLFTASEIEYCEKRKAGKFQSYAARFAAKEAVSKAFGTGMSKGMDWKEIEILNDESGKPDILLSGRAKEVFVGLKVKGMSLSLSHCDNYAIAYVVIEI